MSDDNEKEQTVVEWMIERLAQNGILHSSDIFEANEMFKRQIKEAHIAGFYSPPFRRSRNGEADDYYKEIFKPE